MDPVKGNCWEALDLYYFPDFNHQEIVGKLRGELDRVSDSILGREEIIEQFALALLTRNHQLLLGRTGIAKSLLATEIFAMFEPKGSRTFCIKASVEDTKDNYFGPIDIPLYRDTGRKVRRTKASVLEAHLAFIDELFDTNEQILRDLMLLLSDRKLQEGPEEYPAVLHTVMAASNYLRLNEVTEAVIDRFMFRALIPHETETFLQYRIDRAYERSAVRRLVPRTRLSMAEVRHVSDIAIGHSPNLAVDIPDDVLYLKNVVIRYFIDTMRKKEPGYYVSPRRQAKMIDLLRACALLEGRTVVQDVDLAKMHLGLCTLNAENGETETFKKTARDTLQMLSADPTLREQLVFLTGVLRLLEDFKRDPDAPVDLARVAPPQRGWKEGFLRSIAEGIETNRVRVDALRQAIDDLRPSMLYVNELKIGCLREIQKLTRLHFA